MLTKSLNIDCPYKEVNCDPEDCSCAKYKAWRKANSENAVKEKLIEMNINLDSDLLSLIFKMQRHFISKWHKIDNLTNDEIDYWVDKYLICIEDEVREAREHLNYNSGNILTNNQEFLKEIIDILHFVVNLFIVGNCSSDIIKEKYLSTYNDNVKDVFDIINYAFKEQKDSLKCIESIDFIKDKIKYDLFTNTIDSSKNNSSTATTYTIDPPNGSQYTSTTQNNTNINMLILLNNLLDSCGKVRQNINWKFWKSTKKELDLNKLHQSFVEVFYSLINIFISIDCEPEKIKKIYISKNLENIFRQEFDY